MKRFTETQKWMDPWFMNLPPKWKLLWLYLLDNCDNAGVYDPNMALASVQIGEPITAEEVTEILGKRIRVLVTGKWFIEKFISYQYGTLSEECRPHKKVIELMESHGIDRVCHRVSDTLSEGLKSGDSEGRQSCSDYRVSDTLSRASNRVSDTLQEKEEEEEEYKDKEKGKGVQGERKKQNPAEFAEAPGLTEAIRAGEVTQPVPIPADAVRAWHAKNELNDWAVLAGGKPWAKCLRAWWASIATADKRRWGDTTSGQPRSADKTDRQKPDLAEAVTNFDEF